jgi:hypothetical protein
VKEANRHKAQEKRQALLPRLEAAPMAVAAE